MPNATICDAEMSSTTQGITCVFGLPSENVDSVKSFRNGISDLTGYYDVLANIPTRRLVFAIISFGLGLAITLFLHQYVKGEDRKARLADDFDDNIVDIPLFEQFKYREKATTFDSGVPFRSFYDANNKLGYTFDVVPDIIHLIRMAVVQPALKITALLPPCLPRWNQPKLKFTDVVYYRSMYINHRPQQIMVHCSPCTFSGPYVPLLQGINFTFVPTKFPKRVFGKPLQNPHHATDVTRLLALMKYGGVYLDRDVFVVRSLRPLFRYEAVLRCTRDSLASMMLFFHKNARFLRLYLHTYRYYNGSLWYYNAGYLPYIKALRKHSHLAHCMRYGLECGLDMLHVLYAPHAYADWRNAYAIHTLERWRKQARYDPLPPSIEFNETNIRVLNNAFGQMSRSVLFGTSDLVPPDIPILSVAELTARKDRGEDLTYVSPQSASSKVFWLSPRK